MSTHKFFLVQHRLWAHNRTYEVVLTSTYNLCFRAKIGIPRQTPVKLELYIGRIHYMLVLMFSTFLSLIFFCHDNRVKENFMAIFSFRIQVFPALLRACMFIRKPGADIF